MKDFVLVGTGLITEADNDLSKYIVGTSPPPLINGGGGGRNFHKLSHLVGTKFLAGKGDKPEKGGLM